MRKKLLFASSLLARIRECCSHPRPVTCHTLKEKMWGKYFQMSASEEFRTLWMEFIQNSTGFVGSPSFYQTVTESILEEIIKAQFPLDLSLNSPSNTQALLDFKEQNALRYCGGFLIRFLKCKIKRSGHPLKDSMLLCLEDLLEAGKSTKTHISIVHACLLEILIILL